MIKNSNYDNLIYHYRKVDKEDLIKIFNEDIERILCLLPLRIDKYENLLEIQFFDYILIVKPQNEEELYGYIIEFIYNHLLNFLLEYDFKEFAEMFSFFEELFAQFENKRLYDNFIEIQQYTLKILNKKLIPKVSKYNKIVRFIYKIYLTTQKNILLSSLDSSKKIFVTKSKNEELTIICRPCFFKLNNTVLNSKYFSLQIFLNSVPVLLTTPSLVLYTNKDSISYIINQQKEVQYDFEKIDFFNSLYASSVKNDFNFILKRASLKSIKVNLKNKHYKTIAKATLSNNEVMEIFNKLDKFIIDNSHLEY